MITAKEEKVSRAVQTGGTSLQSRSPMQAYIWFYNNAFQVYKFFSTTCFSEQKKSSFPYADPIYLKIRPGPSLLDWNLPKPE